MQVGISQVLERIKERSAKSRKNYLDLLDYQREKMEGRRQMGCTNLAHVTAGISDEDKQFLATIKGSNFAIVNAYNDMLSAHQPFENYPEIIRQTAREHNATAQVAAGVPAMCDGVTQGMAGMELSLFSRDVIALATSVGLSHAVYDGAFYLGVCDKIVPGLLMAALRFGHIPGIFISAGPMESGIPNKEKAKAREMYAEGKINRGALLESEMKSYHSPGTCTFYGTANSNQMLTEVMGLCLAGSAFVNPGNALRKELIKGSVAQLAAISKIENQCIGVQLDEKAFVNGIVGLMATGGSTNLVMHLIAAAKCAGIIITTQDFSDISKRVPLIAKVYPNGPADVNQFHAAGGMAVVIAELLGNGLLYRDVMTVMDDDLKAYTNEPFLKNNQLQFKDGPSKSLNKDIISSVEAPYYPTGGMVRLVGNIGSGIIKISAVEKENLVTEAPARVFLEQSELIKAFENGELNKDFVAVIPYQGPKSNGMPELHKLTPPLGVLQNQGYKVAIVTDGRMSGASGKVPAAIHISPEAKDGGIIGLIRNGDMVRIDAQHGELSLLVEEHELARREQVMPNTMNMGLGRELFGNFRTSVTSAEHGAISISFNEEGVS